MTHMYTHDREAEFIGLPRKLPIAPHTRLCIKNTATNSTEFKVADNPTSARESKSLLDSKYNEIYVLTKEPLHSHQRTFIEDVRTNQLVATIRRKPLESEFLDAVHVWKGIDEGEPWLCIQGSTLRMEYSITDKLNNDRDVADIFSKKGKYHVKVQPGYDTSIVCFIGMTVHEHFIYESADGKKK